ncbi:FHA domain-containing protein [Sorangium sp. So ce1335]|uniref:FHA domain-containing protein n=1 Tax=Sorangium sp. So ce1335 TaxID=3133335 RepID=UPI003F645860
MSADPNKKSARTFQCRDVLWETFEQMARELECSIDYLINESMKQYARQRSYSPRTPFPPPARVDAPPGSGHQAVALAHQTNAMPNPPLPPPGLVTPGSPPPFGAGASPMVALQQQPAAGGSPYGAPPAAPAYGAPSPPYGVPPVGPVPTPVPALTPPPPPPPGQVRQGAPPPPPPGSSNAGGKRPSLPVPPPIPGRVGGPPPPPTSVTRLGGPPPPLPSQASSSGGRQSISAAPTGRSGPPPPPPLSSVTGYASPIGPPVAPPPYGVPPQAASSVPGPPPMGMGMPSQVPAGPALAAFYAGQRFVVNKDRFIIGRGKQSSDLTIKDPNVSRQHAMVEFLNGQYYMVDMGSTNGVEYNGQRIARKAIVEGDLFRICDHEVRFSYR